MRRVLTDLRSEENVASVQTPLAQCSWTREGRRRLCRRLIDWNRVQIQLKQNDSTDDNTDPSSPSCGRVLSRLQYNGSLPGGDRGRKRSRFALYRREKANGVKPSTVHILNSPQDSKVSLSFPPPPLSYPQYLTRQQGSSFIQCITGAIFGALQDILGSRSVSRDFYNQTGRIPDWCSLSSPVPESVYEVGKTPPPLMKRAFSTEK
ncbi:hypothetical protein DNTS_009816 [Danionella cerebrum]|uniref:Pellino FHA domain-containing protein n=1 Tax=Danionella cerebrum TaxID=2873325 RepID=A0A553MXR1_9TELE|nr:hypothetical protein DNTS_009816 [Danionella translucida]